MTIECELCGDPAGVRLVVDEQGMEFVHILCTEHGEAEKENVEDDPIAELAEYEEWD